MKVNIEIADILGYKKLQKSKMNEKYLTYILIQKLLGHKVSRMTQRYAYLSPKNYQEAIRCLDEMDSSGRATKILGNTEG
jgi:hypothetical protein